MGFSHLHVHTEYSLLDGFITLDDLVRVTYEHGQRVVASTDHGSLASSYKLHEACERLRKDLIDDGSLDPDAALPVVPMYGIEAYMAIGSRFEREMITVPRDSSDTDNYESTSTASHKTKRYNHLTLLAINATGWRNLQAAHRKSFDTVWGKHPRMDYDLLREHSEGIVVLTGCLAGPVAGPVHRGNVDEARDHLATLIDIFGTENTYVELMDHGIDSETAITPTLVGLAEEAGVKCVATNDCHYTREEDSASHEAWLAIQSGSTLDNPKRFRFNGGGYYLKSESQMREIRDEDWWQLACDNTVELSERLPGDIMPEPTRRLPQFPVPDDFVVPVKRAKKKKHSQLTNSSVPWTRADHFLFQKVNDGAKTRYGQSLPDAVKQRILDEFTVISGMGFSDYFLIVDDIITWARSNGIAVGPGRGCLNGDSLVWTTNGYKPITSVDIGDKVRTHTGEIRAVRNRFVYDVTEDLVEVKSYYSGNGVTMTGDHKVLASKADLETDPMRAKGGAVFSTKPPQAPKWTPASELEVGDLVCVPRPPSPGSAPTWIDAAQHLPMAPSGVEFIVTDTEIIERVPTNSSYSHSVREVSRATGLTRNSIQSIVSRREPFDGECLTTEHRDTRSLMMRDKIANELRHRGYSDFSAWIHDVHEHRYSKQTFPHTLTSVSASTGLAGNTIMGIAKRRPFSGDYSVRHKADTRSVMARDRLAAYLKDQGFASFSDWDDYIHEHATIEIRTPRYIELNDDLLFFLGTIVSNGWLRSNSQRRFGVAEQRSTCDETIPDLVAAIWGLDSVRVDSARSDLRQWDIHSAAAWGVINSFMPNYKYSAQTKQVPAWAFDLSTNQKKKLLRGLWWGDGCATDGRWSYSTSSQTLMEQVRELLWAVGAPAGVSIDERSDDRPGFENRAVAWKIRTTPDFGEQKVQFGFVDDDYVYHRIRETNPVTGVKKVYDLEVPEDHSFMTDSYVVHNSSAGSVVSYALGIVNVDPLRFHLLFERFLEPGRPDYPDIDVDFEKRHRDKVIAYISSRWGADMVAKIGTYGVSLGKDAFQKAARILDRSDLIPLSKKLPVHGGKPISLHTALDPANKEAGEFRRTVKVEAGEDFERVIELAQEFEGIRWANGIHACGVIVSDNPLTGLVPMRVDTKSADNPERAGYSVTEWEGPDLEGFGLLKMDILGLKNLDIFVTAAESIRSQTGEAINLLTDVPDPDDASNPRVSRIWDLVSAGKTAGLFQLESSGMTDVCESVAPQSLEDLSAVIALFRPGPISAGMPELYADRKWGRSAVDYTIYTDDDTEQRVIASVLDDTYGCIVYQEQLMRLGAAVAGFDASWRAKLRRAVGKKKKDLMDLVGEKFIADATKEMTLSDGTTKPAFAAETAERLWEHFKGSADYIFNASHTYAYAQLAYSGAYLKANWPAHYGAAILAVTSDDAKRRAAIVSLVQEGIQIASPDVNRSQAKTVALSDTEIIIGLSEIKDVGKVVADLITEREDNGEFTDFADFMSRCPSSVNVAALQSLIQAGALDRFGPRKAMLSVSRAARALPEIRIGTEEFSVVERAKREREKAGLVVAGNHPMTLLDAEIANWKDAHSSQKSFAGLNRVARGSDGDRVAVVAVLSDWDVRWTKAGTSQYARFTIEDGHESINGVAFQKTLTALEAMKSNLEPGDLVKVSGNVSVNERFTSGEVGGDEGLDEPTFEIAREIKAFEIVPVHPHDTPTPDDEPVDLSALLALHGFDETSTADSDLSTPTEKPDSGAHELDIDDEEHFDEEHTEGQSDWAPVPTADDDDDWEVVDRVDEPPAQSVIDSQPTESTPHTAQATSTSTDEAPDPSAAALSLMQRIPADSLSFFTGPGLGDDNGRAVHFFIHDDHGVRVTRSESELGLSPRQMRPLRMAAAAGVGFDLSPGIYALPITGAHENHNLVLVVFDRDLAWPDPNAEPETLTYDMVSAGGEVIVDIGMQVIRMAADSGIKEASLAPSRNTSDSRGSTTSTHT